MALNIKNPEVERLAAEVAQLAGESKTEAIRQALLQRREQLALRAPGRDRREEVMRFLETEIWPKIPAPLLGRRPSREEEEEILGYGPEGV